MEIYIDERGIIHCAQCPGTVFNCLEGKLTEGTEVVLNPYSIVDGFEVQSKFTSGMFIVTQEYTISPYLNQTLVWGWDKDQDKLILVGTQDARKLIFP